MLKLFSVTASIVLLITAALLPGCTRVGSTLNGSGNIIDHDIKIVDFDSLNVKGPFEVEIERGQSYRVTISTDENLISRVLVILDRKTLKLSIEAPATFFPTSLKAKITLPKIAGINLSGMAKATVSGFSSSDELTLFLAGGSSLSGSLEVGIPRIYLSEASQLNLKGKGTRLELDCKSGSKVDLGEFILMSAQVKLKEASEAILNVSGRLDVNLNSSSKVYYLGNPIISDASISGDSTMMRK
jgi:hypothetical protein